MPGNTGDTITLNTARQFSNTGMEVPYDCKRCGATGSLITTETNPNCPNCGRFMEYRGGDSGGL